MKRFFLIVAGLLLAAPPAAAFNDYNWTISSSQTSPFAHVGGANPSAPFDLYLWFWCGHPSGMSAAEFDLAVSQSMIILGFEPRNGFLNAGGAGDLLLAVGGCPEGPVIAGAWTLFGGYPLGSACLVPSAAHGVRVTMDCDPINPHAWPLSAVGWCFTTAPACAEMLLCGGDLAAGSRSWGAVKSLYR